MVYSYSCSACETEIDIIKSHRDLDRDEFCLKCTGKMQHVFKPSIKQLMKMGGMQESAEFNPGLGCVTRGKSHVKEICKEKGFEEIGNETTKTIHNHFDTARAEAIDKRWEDADRGQWVGNGE